MQAGDPSQLGATLVDDGVNFALYSSIAERVELCLFEHDGTPSQCFDLPECRDAVWHGHVAQMKSGQRYGYRVHGPRQPQIGHFCNPGKLLIDPYARKLGGDFVWHTSVFGSNDDDSAAFVPKGVVCERLPPLPAAEKIPWSEATYYELNVRGYTMLHPAVGESERGTFVGMRNKEVIEYIKALGITSVELMPVHAFIDEHHLAKKGLRNFWGYNSLNFFAAESRYSLGDPIGEFRDMVTALHDAGLEVILDVVYNHTAENNSNGPTLSFRGIDNLAYYRVNPDDPGSYINDTGCGNTINADSSVVQRLVLDSLRYWTTDMGVDGFRFDLATILGRHADGFAGSHPLLKAIANDPVLQDSKLTAEPWDPGPGGYQLGQFGQPWSELNDKFRDTTRRFWRGDSEVSGEMAERFRGSSDVFESSGRTPHVSVNKISSHDGFTLADLVSYERRHNENNGENNQDGHSANYSCNYGVEGPTSDDVIAADRRKHRLNLLATLFLAQGTPMLLAGDEFGNSQSGNNNAYAQDNEMGWLDWHGLGTDPAFAAAVGKLIRLRRETPLLRLDRYVHGETSINGRRIAVCWVNPDGSERSSEDWNFGHAFGVLLEDQSDDSVPTAVAILMNAWDEELQFRLPVSDNSHSWQLAFSSAGSEQTTASESMTVGGRSIIVLTRRGS